MSKIFGSLPKYFGLFQVNSDRTKITYALYTNNRKKKHMKKKVVFLICSFSNCFWIHNELKLCCWKAYHNWLQKNMHIKRCIMTSSMQTIYAMSFYKFKFIWIQMGCVKVAKVFYYIFWYSEPESEWKQLGHRN